MQPELYQSFFDIEDHFWWSVGTRRIFFDLIGRLGLDGQRRALDVGCGTGVHLQEFPVGWQLVAGCEYSELALGFCRARGLRDLVRCDATHLPFQNAALDLVTAFDVIEHLDDDDTCIKEVARICRPGGYVLIHVPAFEILWTEKDDVSYHRRRYRRHQLIALVESCGLRVESIFHLNAFLFPAALLRAAEHRIRSSVRPRSKPSADSVDQLYRPPPLVNRFMTRLMALEHRVFGRSGPPFGMSLVCLARKPESAL